MPRMLMLSLRREDAPVLSISHAFFKALALDLYTKDTGKMSPLVLFQVISDGYNENSFRALVTH